jgi:hypothetical protein
MISSILMHDMLAYGTYSNGANAQNHFFASLWFSIVSSKSCDNRTTIKAICWYVVMLPETSER